MTRIMKRIYLLVLASALVGAAFGSFPQSTVSAQGGWDYMCDSWESSCGDGSGGSLGGPSGGSGGGGVECLTIPDGCTSFGCNGNPGNYKCALSPKVNGAICTSGGPCRVR